MKRTFLTFLIACELLWLALVLFVPAARQGKVWFREGRELLSDYFMPRATAAHANPYAEPARISLPSPGWDLEERDRAYPAGALLPLVPFEETWKGAWACNIVMIAVFVAVLFASKTMRKSPLALMAVVLSAPMLFAYERGNPLWYAAAGTLIFMEFYDSPRKGLRLLAAAALAAAASVKVMPAALGILYFSRSNRHAGWRDGVWCVALGVLVFLLPWFFVAGFGSFPDWWRTGHANVAFYGPRTQFGPVQLVRSALILAGVAWQDMRWFYSLARSLATLASVSCLFAAWRVTSRYAALLFACVGMMLLGANMQPYTLLYLLPVFFLWLDGRVFEGTSGRVVWGEAACWFVLLVPLQIPFGDVTMNAVRNLVFMALPLAALFGSARRREMHRFRLLQLYHDAVGELKKGM